MKNGDKIKITIVIDAELQTDLEDVTYDQIVSLINNDEYLQSSVISGSIGESSLDEDTQIFFNTSEVTVTTVIDW